MPEQPDVAKWWPELKPESQEWLSRNRRQTLPPEVWLDVARAGGEASGGYWPPVENSLSGFDLSDSDWDLVERYLDKNER
jgi:hypothetical protein